MMSVNDRLFWQQLLRRVTRRVGRENAEDVLHSAYVRLRAYREQHAVADLAAFLLRTAVNIAIDNRRHDSFVIDQPVDTACADWADPTPLQDEVIEARIRLQKVWAGLDQLAPRTRDVFLMHRLEGLRHREIAVRVGISQSAVEKHIARAALFLTEFSRRDEETRLPKRP
jgi:RNA polymerase sigma factor (sigma-70 family)